MQALVIPNEREGSFFLKASEQFRWWFRLGKISHGVYPESVRRVRDDKCWFGCGSGRQGILLEL